MALKHYLVELSDSAQPLKHSGLIQLSSLTAEELRIIQDTWPRIPRERRRQLLAVMAALSDDNVDLDFTAIFKLALRDQDAQVREQAIGALWECEERSFLSALLKLLECDPVEGVRAASAQALGHFAALAEHDKLLPHDRQRIRRSLMAVIHNPSESLLLRRRALEAVSPLNDEDVRALIESAYKHHDPKMRESALYAMGINANPRWLPTLITETRNDDPAMRYESASACGRIGEEVAVPHLLPLLHRDEDPQVRLSTIQAMGAIGGNVAKKALDACLRSPDDAVKEAAGRALEALEAEEDPLSM